MPDYSNYLAYILITQLPDIQGAERSVAGYLLSTNVRFHAERISPESVDYVKTVIFQGLDDQHPEVRKATASVIPWMFRSLGGAEAWPEALTKLMGYIDGQGLTQDVR